MQARMCDCPLVSIPSAGRPFLAANNKTRLLEAHDWRSEMAGDRSPEKLARKDRQGRAAHQDDKAAGLKHPEDGKSSLTPS